MADWIATERLLDLALKFVGFAGAFVALAGLASLVRDHEWYRRSSDWWREFRTNTVFYFFDGLVISPFITLPALWFATLLPSLPLVPLPITVTICLAVIVGDFIGYWRHRLQHSRWLWPAHAVHHSDQEMTWLTAARIHPLDRLSTVTVDTLALALLGLPPYAILINNLVRNWYGYFEHADVRLGYGPLSAIFMSPVAHRWHHSVDMPGKNFATLFSIWDHLFRTHYQANRPPREMGIEQPPRGFLGALVYPLRPRSYIDDLELVGRLSAIPLQPEPSEQH
jgi:sterol desaturase/sphingolipid hydroxylase (fatty acid hydroxylase superfamily)